METYQILGLVGSLLLVLALAIMMLGMAVMPVGFGMMGPMMWSMGFFPFFLIGLPSVVLGILGSAISDRTAAGVLLILAGILSLPVFFGFFGISFILLIVAGALALSKK
ncbi:hypothetical protein ATG_09960 [Desulfurococcaceae archaeon AG1]|nr:hypothetical protein ATG_09960 [Desulfurococcaceae archaeon AG1]